MPQRPLSNEIVALHPRIRCFRNLASKKKGRCGRELLTEITTDASPETLWEVLTDLRQYSEWNPFIVSATGEGVVGARSANRMTAVRLWLGRLELGRQPAAAIDAWGYRTLGY